MSFSWHKAAVAVTWAASILGGAVGAGHPAAEPANEGTRPPALPEAVLERTRPIFDGKSLDGWVQVPPDSWTVKDGAMASTGAGRGVIYTREDYKKYRLFFTMRHVSGKPDH
jgi:hypothetical protein